VTSASDHDRLIDVVVIGRNEGERLRRCLESIRAGEGVRTRIIYVDSGSTDASVELAESFGAEVVSLDMSTPFTAARGRNAGLERTRADLVQFVDGDCELHPTWLRAGAEAIEREENLVAVFGSLRERHPEASLFNRLSEVEWDTLVGEAPYCGGIALMRADAVKQAAGFDPTIMAGEEPELCERLRAAGGRIMAIDAPMCAHDAAIHRLSQWWRRQVRAGYGMGQVAFRRNRVGGRVFTRQIGSALLWGVGWPLAMLTLLAVAIAWSALALGAALLALLMGAMLARIAIRGRRKGLTIGQACAHAGLTMLGKAGLSAGLFRWASDRLRGRTIDSMLYKTGAPPQPPAPATPRSNAAPVPAESAP